MSGTPYTSNLVVPIVGLSPAAAASTYFTRLGTPESRIGNAAAEWEVVAAGDPDTASDRLRSSRRAALRWWAYLCFRSTVPGTTPRRAFLSAFYQLPPNPAEGVDGCASSLLGTDAENQVTLFQADMPPETELFFNVSWNGPNQLEFVSGKILIASS